LLKNSKIKLIAFDLDGTVLNEKKKLSEYTKNMLNKIDCLKVIVSARTLDNINEFSREIQIDGVVYSNGSGVEFNNKLLDNHYISLENYYKLIELIFNVYPNISVKVKGDKNIFINSPCDKQKINNIEKITIKFDNNNKNKLISLIKKLKVFNIDIIDDSFLIITNKYATKYNGLRKILLTQNINLDEVIYFGNDLNDLELFKKIPLAVAVNNACFEIISESTYICDSNNHDGVGKFLGEFFNNKKIRRINKFNGGSVCHVNYDKTNRCIHKEVNINNEGINNGYSKLFYEAKHMQQYNLLNKYKFYPDIYEIKEKNQKLVVKMEYLYQGLTLTDLLLNKNIGNKFIKNSLSNIIDKLFSDLYFTKKNVFPNNNYLNINYFDRLNNRLETVLKILRKNNNYPRIKSAIQDGIYLNNKYYPTVLEYNRFLQKDKGALQKLIINNCTESHQDLIPSNIVVDYNNQLTEITNFKLIDPRGEGDTGLDTRHFTYDIGKLLFGLNGFELFRRLNLRKNYSLSSEHINNIYHYKFKINSNILTDKFMKARNTVLKKIEDNKYKYFDSINLIETYKEKILLAEAYCFFADLPCRLINGDDEEVLLCFYLRGIECLTEVMNLLYGKDMVFVDD